MKLRKWDNELADRKSQPQTLFLRFVSQMIILRNLMRIFPLGIFSESEFVKWFTGAGKEFAFIEVSVIIRGL